MRTALGFAREEPRPVSAKPSTKRAAPRKAARKPAAQMRGSKAAQQAVERAQKAGALGPGGTSAQRALRDGAIVVSLAAGRTQAEVASEFAVSERTVRMVEQRSAQAPSMLDDLPMDIIEERLRALRRRIADFSALAYQHADANPSVAVAAMKGAERIEETLIEVLSYIRKLPGNLELFHTETVLRSIAAEMGKAFARVKAGELTPEAADELVMKFVREGEARERQRALPSNRKVDA
jgi:hypothetical protein